MAQSKKQSDFSWPGTDPLTGGRLGDIDCSGDDPIVKQEFVEECDINVILARCLRGGGLSHVSSVAPVFMDVSQAGDFASAVRRVHDAEEAFMQLPAVVRSRFDNDPAKLIAFIQDDSNRAEAEKLGLVEPKVPPAVEAPAAPAGKPAPMKAPLKKGVQGPGPSRAEVPGQEEQ